MPQNTIAVLRDAIIALTGATDYLEQFGTAPVVTPAPQPPGTHAWRCNQCETVIVLNEGAEFPDDCSGCHRTTGWVREVAVKQRRPAALAPPQQETPRERLLFLAQLIEDGKGISYMERAEIVGALRARALPRETPPPAPMQDDLASPSPPGAQPLDLKEIRGRFLHEATKRQASCPHGAVNHPERCISCVVDHALSEISSLRADRERWRALPRETPAPPAAGVSLLAEIEVFLCNLRDPRTDLSDGRRYAEMLAPIREWLKATAPPAEKEKP